MERLYKVKRGILGRWEGDSSVKYHTGDFILLDDETATALGNRVELAEEAPVVDESTPETEESTPEPEETEETQAEPEETQVEPDTSDFEYLNDLHWAAARDVVRSLETEADLLAAKAVENARPRPRNAVLAAIESGLRNL